jgi:hypothetical protein
LELDHSHHVILLSIIHRYLTKLSDQVISLMSEQHSDAIVWGEDQSGKAPWKKKPSTRDRVYNFKVQKTKEQEESVSMHEGFKVRIGDYTMLTLPW